MEKENQKRTPVRLKGMGKSLLVKLNPRDPADYLKEEISKLFGELNNFAKNAPVLLDMGKGKGFEDLFSDIEFFLKDNFGVGSVSRTEGFGKKKGKDSRKAAVEKSAPNEGDVMILTGKVRSGQKVSARKHLLILGDVNPGAEVMAGGDILIMGSLMGTAVAGQPDNNDAIILSLDFRPIQVQIGSYLAAGLPPSKEKIAEFAHVEDGGIIVEDYLKADPFGRVPRPRSR